MAVDWSLICLMIWRDYKAKISNRSEFGLVLIMSERWQSYPLHFLFFSPSMLTYLLSEEICQHTQAAQKVDSFALLLTSLLHFFDPLHTLASITMIPDFAVPAQISEPTSDSDVTVVSSCNTTCLPVNR